MTASQEEVVFSPAGSLDVLSQHEVGQLRDAGHGGLRDLFRRCALAVLNCGGEVDDARQVFEQFRDFEIELVQEERGVRLRLENAPADAFVDGELIRGIREHLSAVLRDVVYVHTEIDGRMDLNAADTATEVVFQILRNAGVLRARVDPNIVVCWGGHAIGRAEYDYSKSVGYELGLRGLDVCTGCGPGAMKGPMKGAALGHAKQRKADGRYLGMTEPGIIAAEAPNPIVNELVILPDIEKRLEAFVRLGHGVAVFPGGAGTAEEILYLLGILLRPENAELPFPLVFTGPAGARGYFEHMNRFIAATLGEAVTQRYEIILDDPVAVARRMHAGLRAIKEYRRHVGDAFFFNWRLAIDPVFQIPFAGTHAAMSALELSKDLPRHELAANLRRAFSGIVSGNVKADGIRAIEAHGPFQIKGDPDFLEPLDELLCAFVDQSRMRLPGVDYNPCYRIVR